MGRTTESTVTFRRPFDLEACDQVQPAGTYRLVTEEEQVAGISFVAFRRTATLLYTPAHPIPGQADQVIPVDPLELQAALEADRRNVE